MSYNLQTNIDSPNYTPASQARAVFGYDRVIEGITIHWWGDPNQNPQYNNIVNYLSRANGNTSAHYVATGTNRQVACIVAPGDVAWHSGSAWGNARTIGIELDPRARDEDYDVAAELIADIRSAFGDVPIYWHNYFVATSCPGVWNPDRLDKLSYTKYSHATDWGKGGDINPKTPVTPPAPQPQPEAPKTLYKLFQDNKQVAAYSTDVNAYRGYVQYGKTGVIKLSNKDVTAEVVAKFLEPSPTAGQPDSGKPVVEKDDFDALEKRVGVLEQLWEKFINFIKGIK